MVSRFSRSLGSVHYYDYFKISSMTHKRYRKMENILIDYADLVTIMSD